jgi:hypothetical protein
VRRRGGPGRTDTEGQGYDRQHEFEAISHLFFPADGSEAPAGRPPGEDRALTLEVLTLEIARQAKLAGLPRAGSQESGSWSGGADLDAEARVLLAVQRLRNDPWVAATAGSIVHGERGVAAPASL